MRTRSRYLFVAIVMALFALPLAVVAEEPGDEVGTFTLEGTWWRNHMDGGGPAYGATIQRVGAKSYTALFSGNLVDVAGIAGLPPVTHTTTSPGVIEKVGRNDYEFTWILWYGDSAYDAPHRGTVYAIVCWGPLVQDGEDHFFFDNSCFASINPCYYGWDAARCTALGDDLWDPFSDPDLICSGSPPISLEYQRVPLLHECPDVE